MRIILRPAGKVTGTRSRPACQPESLQHIRGFIAGHRRIGTARRLNTDGCQALFDQQGKCVAVRDGIPHKGDPLALQMQALRMCWLFHMQAFFRDQDKSTQDP